MIKTNEKMMDGSFKYWHDCSVCGKPNSYLNRKGMVTGHCDACLTVKRRASSGTAIIKARDKQTEAWNKTLFMQSGLSRKALQEIFNYLPEGVLTYKSTLGPKRLKDTVVGTIGTNGYRYTTLNTVSYSIAYLVWVYHNGIPLTNEIMRIDGVISNTRIENLQLNRLTLTTWEFIRRALDAHGYKYDYSLTEYTHNKNSVCIVCKEHGQFQQEAHSHLLGAGCPLCSKTGFKSNLPALLYYLSINNGQAYKIGITNNTLSIRYTQAELEKITVLKVWEYDIGAHAYEREQEILKEFSEYKYEGVPLLVTGNTELFNKDVLQLETSNLRDNSIF